MLQCTKSVEDSKDVSLKGSNNSVSCDDFDGLSLRTLYKVGGGHGREQTNEKLRQGDSPGELHSEWSYSD